MSGHSKWATIKHKKGKLDAQRGKIFTKLIKEITIAARMGGGDPEGNPRLRQAILTARGQNMPFDNIDRAVKKGTGELEGVIYEEVTYEGYGPGGAAIIVDCQTDNKNRCVSEIRRVFTKAGGNMASQNAVAWMFDQKGLIEVDHAGVEEDALVEAAIEAGADDVQDQEELFEVTTAPSDLMAVADALKSAGFNVTSAKFAKIPQNMIRLTGKEAEQMLRFVETLEDLDDTQNVWTNFDVDESELESLMG
ncbi:MAG TPA: YebC/PmpR family DNA-binding transcriptional regulator [Myxococcota bacterium]|nr:YebC/PmpR family DNA-binding transcriptional regulator [Myxococcota bacterium]HOA12597.1 YebC/PmpR family DNA-binding transcriptional regulator [Myxococcota bacterium]HOC98839.1 YebC/PmpR family DNA-binding transcriptional regulator [Myxococcota bacterium]HOH76436.1 YebC/PmpR family DNA-binding transcriptional regulator [Myxococcota bacterium]HPV04443.1 YebC/PmpR family DNA-binding transcriptional regulator [Myxococcota bacterium]